jgi:hypothetical protein
LIRDYSQEREALPLKPTLIDGIDPVNCIFCGSKWCIEFDLTQHLLEEHRMDLVELKIGKGKMPIRVAYAIDKGRTSPVHVSTSSPNFDSLELELQAAHNRWIQANPSPLQATEVTA